MRPMIRLSTLAASALALLVIVGCAPAASSAPAPIYTRVNEAQLKSGDAIPTPTGDVILTATGNIGTHNNGDKIEMDRAAIESVGLVEYKVRDPFELNDVVFRGVLMSDLLSVWQVPASATNLEMIALNDYVVEVPISDIRQWPVLYAMQADGQYMEVASRGPAMLVYPYDNFEFDQQIYNDRWIWQIKSVNVQ
jgi:hypothetical protein